MTISTLPLATTITGSLPRPHWFTENLRGRPFLTAMGGDLRIASSTATRSRH